MSVAFHYQALPLMSELFRSLVHTPELRALAFAIAAQGRGLFDQDLSGIVLPPELAPHLDELRRLVEDARAHYPGIAERNAWVDAGIGDLRARFGDHLLDGQRAWPAPSPAPPPPEGPDFTVVSGPTVAMAAVVMRNLEPDHLLPAPGPEQDSYRALRTLVLAAAARGELLLVRTVD